MDERDEAPPPASRLTRTKEAWARDHRLPKGPREGTERLPPGQHLVQNWPVLDLGLLPNVTTADFRLEVVGAVEAPLTWRWADFMAQPQVDSVSDIHCVTSWSRFDNRWQGVAMRHLLELVRPREEARFVLLHSHDGYTTNLPLEDLADANVLIAHSWNGSPLTPEHGGPARLVLPHLYFWKSAKWLRRLEFRTSDRAGFWEERGYHERGDPWTEERYAA